MTPSPQTPQQTPRPMVMWRVTLHCHQTHRNGFTAFFTEIVDVEAPENDLEAAARTGQRKLRELRHDVAVMRIDVKRLDFRTPPSRRTQQTSLWDAEHEAPGGQS